jgi:hypothetical protein
VMELGKGRVWVFLSLGKPSFCPPWQGGPRVSARGSSFDDIMLESKRTKPDPHGS